MQAFSPAASQIGREGPVQERDLGVSSHVFLPVPREWDRGRERRSRGEYRDYDRNRRERFSPPRHELSPPQKRMRRDW